MAEKRTWKCTRCGVEFSPPHFHCEDGRMHEVEQKTYYAAAGSLITYVTDERIVELEGGRKKLIMPRKVQFNRGAYTTSDPEEQFGLDSNGAMIDAEEWRRRFLTPEDALNLKNRELEAKHNRLVEEHNALLAQVQAAKQKQPAAGKTA